MNTPTAWAVDIGGTTVKTGTVSTSGVLSDVSTFSTPRGNRAGSELLEALVSGARRSGAGVIGVGTPGLVTPEGSLAGPSENISNWGPFDLQDHLIRETGKAVTVLNDVSAATYGEYRCGAGVDAGSDPMVMIALGTGLGGGLVINGELQSGYRGLAGEFGMMVVHPQGRPAASVYGGAPAGSLESYASATGIVATLRELAPGYSTPLAERVAGASFGGVSSCDASSGGARPVTAETVYEHLRQGDPLAAAVHELTCRMLARGLSAIISVVAPRVIVLGGGVMRSGTVILDSVDAHLQGCTYPPLLAGVSLRAASLPHAGVIGAGLYALMREEGRTVSR